MMVEWVSDCANWRKIEFHFIIQVLISISNKNIRRGGKLKRLKWGQQLFGDLAEFPPELATRIRNYFFHNRPLEYSCLTVLESHKLQDCTQSECDTKSGRKELTQRCNHRLSDERTNSWDWEEKGRKEPNGLATKSATVQSVRQQDIQHVIRP